MSTERNILDKQKKAAKARNKKVHDRRVLNLLVLKWDTAIIAICLMVMYGYNTKLFEVMYCVIGVQILMTIFILYLKACFDAVNHEEVSFRFIDCLMAFRVMFITLLSVPVLYPFYNQQDLLPFIGVTLITAAIVFIAVKIKTNYMYIFVNTILLLIFMVSTFIDVTILGVL